MTQAIFLSYASQDAAAARRICDGLRAAGLEVWFDQSELRGGDAWDASIRKQIKECALFVPMISASTNAREEGYFRLEWKLAVDRSHLIADHKAFFLPVVLGDLDEVAAHVPDKFRERQWSRLNSEAAITAFAERIGKVLAGSGVSGKSAPHTPPVPDISSATAARAKADDTPSIAVLAFANRSASADDEYFSDGLADELLNVLARIKGLRVAARTSAFSFKNKATTVDEIGRILNVATVLEGSVRKSGNRVRISVQLVKVFDGYQLWSETYDRMLDDIFAVQDDIAQSVVKELRTALMGGAASPSPSSMQYVTSDVASEIAHATSTRSDNPEAQRLCLQARFYFNKRRPDDVRRGVEFCEQAIALDPNYADAHARLAHGLLHKAFYGGAMTLEGATVLADLRKARVAVEAALALDPTLAMPHAVQSWVAWIADHDGAASMRELRAAQSLAPTDAEVLRNVGYRQMELGQFEKAEAALSKGLALDPLSIALRINSAMLARHAGQPDESLRRLNAALDIDEGFWWAHDQLSSLARDMGNYEKAVEYRARAAELRGDHASAQYHRDSFARGGWEGYLAAIIREPKHSFSRYAIAQAQVDLGDVDNAFATLNDVVDNYEQFSGWFKVDAALAPLRADPRYAALLKRAGFPE